MIIAGVNLEPFLLSVAAKLAHLGDDQQAAFLNAFAKELRHVCETKNNFDMQSYAIRKLASEEFKDICETVAYKEQA